MARATQSRLRARRVDVTEVDDTLTAPDYASAFQVTAPPSDARSPERWARDMFEGAPFLVRSNVLFGWRYLMRFRLGPRPSPTHVLGWKIHSSTPDLMVLTLHSPLVTAHKTIRVDQPPCPPGPQGPPSQQPHRVTVTTSVRFERPRGRVIWSAITPIHHLTEPYLLGHAAAQAKNK